MIARLAGIARWRLATSVVAAVLFAAWLLVLLGFFLAPCGDFMCPRGFEWVLPLAGGVLATIVWLFASRRTAAPLYLVSAWLGASAAASVLSGPRHVDPLILANTLYQLVAIGALVDLRHQTRGALVSGFGLVALGAWLIVTQREISFDTLAPLVAGLLPLGAWWLSRDGAQAGPLPPAASETGAE